MKSDLALGLLVMGHLRWSLSSVECDCLVVGRLIEIGPRIECDLLAFDEE